MILLFKLLMALTFVWDAPADANSSDPGIKVTGYKLRLGPGDGTYPLVVDVGNTTSKQMPDDTKYSAAIVSAYNAKGFESAPSTPRVYRPTQPGQPTAQ